MKTREDIEIQPLDSRHFRQVRVRVRFLCISCRIVRGNRQSLDTGIFKRGRDLYTHTHTKETLHTEAGLPLCEQNRMYTHYSACFAKPGFYWVQLRERERSVPLKFLYSLATRGCAIHESLIKSEIIPLRLHRRLIFIRRGFANRQRQFTLSNATETRVFVSDA